VTAESVIRDWQSDPNWKRKAKKFTVPDVERAFGILRNFYRS
jgi:hypothetical protein